VTDGLATVDAKAYMSVGRVEAFSDGVIAIIITIMVLELKMPADAILRSLLSTLPLLLVYALSFLTVAIMWVNHHHYLKTARRPDPQLLWANNNLLFWMSLIPFATRYLGQNLVAPLPVSVYAGLLAVTALSFYWLIAVLGEHNAHHVALAEQYRHQRGKSLMTVAIYAGCASLAWFWPRVALATVIVLPGLYFLPDRKLVDGEN
jgi:uncharacterized membrane protein